MVTIASIVREVLDKVHSYNLTLEQMLAEALEISKRTVIHEAKAPTAGVRGPPGTGKTKIMEGLINDEDVIDELLNNNIKFVYVAPTNELTISGFRRALMPIMRRLMESSYDIARILSMVRIYGSAVPAPYLGRDFELLRNINNKIDKDLLKKIVYGGIDDALFIFTTDYQRASARSRGSSHKFIMFVDEASKSPFYLPFNPISDSELRNLASGNRSGVIHGLVVVGDDRQAIALGPEYQGFSKSLLVLPKIEEVLKSLGLDEQFKTLRVTFRLPSPTEEPIGDGFYGDVGGLRAYEEARIRIKSVFKGMDIRERFNKCEKARDDPLWYNVIRMLDLALGDLEDPKSIIIANTQREIPSGQQFEPCRVKLAVYFALALSCLSEKSLGISIIAPYRELVDAARFYYRKLSNITGVNRTNIRFLTVQSMLGGEDDIIISMLGKEWNPKHDEPTIYFREPENLNVQFSRHRLMLIVIGNVIRLRNTAADTAQVMGLSGYNAQDIVRIRKTLDIMLELAGISGLSSRRRAEDIRSEYSGDGAILRKVICP